MAAPQVAQITSFVDHVTSRVAEVITPGNLGVKGPPPSKVDPTRNVLLRDGILELLRPALLYWGYRIYLGKALEFREPPLEYHRILSPQGSYQALLQVGTKQLEDPNRLVSRFAVLFQRTVTGLFVFAEEEIEPDTDDTLQEAALYWENVGFKPARFFNRRRVKKLEEAESVSERAAALRTWLGLEEVAVAGPQLFQDEMAVTIIADLATRGAPKGKEFFKHLVGRLPGGGAAMIDIWSGNANADARELLKAAGTDLYPPGSPKEGYSPLGCLFEILTTEEMGEGEGKRYLQELMIKHRLAPDESLDGIRKGFGLGS